MPLGRQGAQSGPGDSKFGAKFRFFENKKLDLDIGTYPHVEVNNTHGLGAPRTGFQRTSFPAAG